MAAAADDDSMTIGVSILALIGCVVLFSIFAWVVSDGPVRYSNPGNNHDCQKVPHASISEAQAEAIRLERRGYGSMNTYYNSDHKAWYNGRSRY